MFPRRYSNSRDPSTPGRCLAHEAKRLIGIEGPNWLRDPAWAMFWVIVTRTLKGVGINMVIFLAAIMDLPGELFDFLAPKGTEWDAPLEGEAFAQPSVPGPEVFDLRRRPPKAAVRPRPRSHAVARDPLGPVEGDDAVVYGSNNWAVAGAHTAHGGAILANDMHLGISVPNTWYRASLAWPALEGERRVSGVMLPGAPFVVAGSNGRVAWGFTNSQGDWADLVLLEPVAGETDAYLTPEGPRKRRTAGTTSGSGRPTSPCS